MLVYCGPGIETCISSIGAAWRQCANGGFALAETATDPRAVGVCAMLYLLAHVSAPRDTRGGLGVSLSVLGI